MARRSNGDPAAPACYPAGTATPQTTRGVVSNPPDYPGRHELLISGTRRSSTRSQLFRLCFATSTLVFVDYSSPYYACLQKPLKPHHEIRGEGQAGACQRCDLEQGGPANEKGSPGSAGSLCRLRRGEAPHHRLAAKIQLSLATQRLHGGPDGGSDVDSARVVLCKACKNPRPIWTHVQLAPIGALRVHGHNQRYVAVAYGERRWLVLAGH